MWIVFLLIQTLAINIPKAVSMKDLEKQVPEDSFVNVCWNKLLHFKWVVITAVFLSLSFLAITLLWKSSKQDYRDGEDIEEEQITLKGRRILLPRHECFNKTEKYYLCEDFPEMSTKDQVNEIYHETLISQLKFPTA